jgi:leucyl/phenylalanyl-tRNA--protein transferase
MVAKMSKINFPNPRYHEFTEWVLFGDYYYNARDIIGFGGDLTIENLRNAYRRGIFPWHVDGLPLPWYCPERRAILEFDRLHLPKSLRKEWKKTAFTFSIDGDFKSVIAECARAKRSDGYGTWITDEFIRAFCEFHAMGNAHSVEVRDASGELVGGLYGVDAGGVFCGESMFHHRSNASKFALLHLIEHLKTRGATWLDIQVMTPHFKVLGAEEIPRREFLDKLEETQKLGLKLF